MATSWGVLEQQSSSLVPPTDGSGMPRVQLTLDELLAQSSALKARTARFEIPMETEAGALLLARSGFDAGALLRDVVDFEERSRYMCAHPEASSGATQDVDSYMRQVHESAVLSAVRLTSRQAASDLNAFRDGRRHADWKRSRVEGVDRLGAGFGAAANAGATTPSVRGLAGMPQEHPGAAAPSGRFAAPAHAPSSVSAPTRIGTLAPRVRAYDGPVQAALEAHGFAPPKRCELAALLAAAAEPPTRRDELDAAKAAVHEGSDAAGAARSAEEVWSLLVSMVTRAGLAAGADASEAYAAAFPANGALRDAGGDAARDDLALALLRGARDYLEQQHDHYVAKVLKDKPELARLGGTPGPLPHAEAYLRVRAGGAAEATDADDAWPVLFYLARSGHYAAARDNAPRLLRDLAGVGSDGHGASATLDALLAWFDAEVAAATHGSGAAAAADEALRRAAADEALEVHRSRRVKASARPYQLALMAACTRDPHLEQRLGREHPSFCESIQDYLWLKLCLVHTVRAASNALAAPLASPSQAPSPGMFASPGAGVGGAAALSTAYSVEELRTAMNRYPPSRYNQNGRAPHQAAITYLCTLQPYAAAKHLWDGSGPTPAPAAGDAAGSAFAAAPPPTQPLAVASDGAHLALALCHHGVYAAAGEPGASVQGDPPGAFARQVSSLLLRRYAMDLMRVDVAKAASVAAAACHVCFREGGIDAMAEALVEGLSRCADRNAILGEASRGRELYVHAPVAHDDELEKDGSAVSRLAPRVGARKALLHRAGQLCELRGDYDAARELFVRCGAPHLALSILNRRLSDAFHGGGSAAAGAAELLAQCQAAKELCDDYVRSHYGAHAGTPEGNACHECEREAEALKQLLELREASLRASSASAGTAASQEVLDRLYTLPWLPFEIHRVEECAGVKLNRMHPAVRARLPDALLLAAYALRDRIKAEAGASSENRTKLAALAQYAGAVGGRAQLPGHVLKTVSEVLSMFQG